MCMGVCMCVENVLCLSGLCVGACVRVSARVCVCAVPWPRGDQISSYRPPYILSKRESTCRNEIQLAKEIKLQEKQMLKAAKNMEFEKAADYRDELKKLKDLLFVGFIDTKLEKVSRPSGK